MNREQAQELFSAYREGELSTEQARAFEALLNQDEETRAEYEIFCRALESLELLRPLPAPDDFLEKVQSRLRRRSDGRFFGSHRSGSLGRVPYEIFSLILILIILALYLLLLPVLEVVPTAEDTLPPEGPAGAGQP